MLTIGTDDPLLAGAQAIIKVSGHQYRWLAGGCLVNSGFFAQCYNLVIFTISLCVSCQISSILRGYFVTVDG